MNLLLILKNHIDKIKDYKIYTHLLGKLTDQENISHLTIESIKYGSITLMQLKDEIIIIAPSLVIKIDINNPNAIKEIINTIDNLV